MCECGGEDSGRGSSQEMNGFQYFMLLQSVCRNTCSLQPVRQDCILGSKHGDALGSGLNSINLGCSYEQEHVCSGPADAPAPLLSEEGISAHCNLLQWHCCCNALNVGLPVKISSRTQKEMTTTGPLLPLALPCGKD